MSGNTSFGNMEWSLFSPCLLSAFLSFSLNEQISILGQIIPLAVDCFFHLILFQSTFMRTVLVPVHWRGHSKPNNIVSPTGLTNCSALPLN